MALKKVFDYGDAFDIMTYPAGEPHVRLRPEFAEQANNGWYRPFIVTEALDWNHLMIIKIGDQVLKDNGINATFVVPYMPFARHDRKNDTYDSSPVPFVLDLLATVHVITVDPHSDVAGIFPSYSQAEVVKLYEQANLFPLTSLVAIPDAGATKKAYSWLNGRDHVQCLKTRSPKTGKLSGFQVVNPELVEGRDVVIIDDICDGGGTFLGLGDQLMIHGARSLSLGVTHGLFTKGFEELNRMFTRIFTLDTCATPPGGSLFHVSTEELIMEGKWF